MTRRQQFLTIMLCIMLSSAVFTLALSGNVQGQATIPTRTRTPNPDQPTDPPPDPTDDNGGGNSTAEPTDPPPSRSTSTPSSNATDTPIPSAGTPAATNTTLPPVVNATLTSTPIGTTATATSVGIISASATPFGGVLAPGTTPVSFPVVATAFPTAEQCGEPPTFTTIITALVYTGPGNEYTFVETLASDETRPIVGRAIYSTWWLIQLDGKFNQAWINDRTGIIQGNTANVPEVPAPAIDGVAPTPGIPWAPTPVNECVLTPTATATSSTEVVGSSITTVDVGSQESSAGADSNTQVGTEGDARNIAAATAAPLEISTPASTPNLLPIAGLVLIIAAVFIALFLRRNPGGGEPSA